MLDPDDPWPGGYRLGILVGAKETQGAQGDVGGTTGNQSEKHKVIENILLVEDNEINLEIMNSQLNSLNYKVDTAVNGKDAIMKWRTEKYSAIFMDCQMPEMDGYEATRRIRKNEDGVKNPDIPVIAITANALKGDREKCLAAGMNDYLSKPIDPMVLKEMLDKWLLDADDIDFDSEEKDQNISDNPEDRVFVREILLERLMGDTQLADIVITGFLKDIPFQLDEIKRNIDERKPEKAGMLSHKVKGAAGNIASPSLQGIAGEMEKVSWPLDRRMSSSSRPTTAMNRIPLPSQ